MEIPKCELNNADGFFMNILWILKMFQITKCGSTFINHLPALSALCYIYTCKSDKDDTSPVSHGDQAMTAIKYAASTHLSSGQGKWN